MSRILGKLASRWRVERPDLDAQTIAIATYIKRIADLLELETRMTSQANTGQGPGDARILLALRRNGVDTPMRPTDLFRSLLITSGAVTKQVDRLERGGLVERRRDPAYKRGLLIGLTERGRERADRIMDELFSAQSRLGAAFASIPEAERAAGLHFLYLLQNALREAGITQGQAPPPPPAEGPPD